MLQAAQLSGIVLALYVGTAHGLTVDEVVTPQYVNDHKDTISVSATPSDDLIEFSVTLMLKDYQFAVLNTVVSDGKRTLSKNHTSVFSRIPKATFRLSVPRDLVATSTFSVAACTFVQRENGTLTPIPGTINYMIQIQEFVPRLRTDRQ